MGFHRETIKALLTHYRNLELDQALEFLLKSDQGWKHTFIPRKAVFEREKCAICGEVVEEHHPDTPLSQPRQSTRPLSCEVKSVRGISSLQCCGICLRTFEDSDMFTLNCGHSFCLECVLEYLSFEISEGRVAQIHCPEVNCEVEFPSEQLERLLPPGLFAKYSHFTFDLQVRRDPNAHWCPTPDCGTVLYKVDDNPKVRCPKCRTELCFVCGVSWHTGRSCVQMLDISYLEWDIQACPQCRMPIEKEGGCNHMTCTNCDYQWCWLCRARYTEFHYDPLNPLGCPGLEGGEEKHWPCYKRWILKVLLLLFLPLSKNYAVIPVRFGWMIASAVHKSMKCSGWAKPFALLVTAFAFLFGCAMGPVLILVCFIPFLCYMSYQFVLSVKFCLRKCHRARSEGE